MEADERGAMAVLSTTSKGKLSVKTAGAALKHPGATRLATKAAKPAAKARLATKSIKPAATARLAKAVKPAAKVTKPAAKAGFGLPQGARQAPSSAARRAGW